MAGGQGFEPWQSGPESVSPSPTLSSHFLFNLLFQALRSILLPMTSAYFPLILTSWFYTSSTWPVQPGARRGACLALERMAAPCRS
jgi:hypothetical protein